MKQLVWLDLCSGLGGASQPALDRGWKVIRVDIDPRFKPDIVADVRALPLKPFHVDVLWASPPCQEFSKFGLRCFFPDPPEPNLSIAQAVKEHIATICPQFWIVENVFAARPWLNQIFGRVHATPPGHALWSNLGFLLPNIKAHKGNVNATHASGKRWGLFGRAKLSIVGRHYHDGRLKGREFTHAAEVARIPYEIGECICAAVERRMEEEHEQSSGADVGSTGENGSK